MRTIGWRSLCILGIGRHLRAIGESEGAQTFLLGTILVRIKREYSIWSGILLLFSAAVVDSCHDVQRDSRSRRS